VQVAHQVSHTCEPAPLFLPLFHHTNSPQCGRLKQMKEIPDSADHIKSTSWRGNVKVNDVSLQTSWNRGRHLAEDEYCFVKTILAELEELSDIDLLAPLGVLLFDLPLAENDIDESLIYPIPQLSLYHLSHRVQRLLQSWRLGSRLKIVWTSLLLQKVSQYNLKMRWSSATRFLLMAP